MRRRDLRAKVRVTAASRPLVFLILFSVIFFVRPYDVQALVSMVVINFAWGMYKNVMDPRRGVGFEVRLVPTPIRRWVPVHITGERHLEGETQRNGAADE